MRVWAGSLIRKVIPIPLRNLGPVLFEFSKPEKLPIRRWKTAPFLEDLPLQLVFDDSLTAFEHACEGQCPLREGIVLPALVLDARELFGAATAVMFQDNGRQIASVRVASTDGGFIVSASTSGALGPTLQPGHLVAWQAVRCDPQVATNVPARKRRFGWARLKDKRLGWVGLIEGTLKLEYKNGGWTGDERFAD